MLALTLIALTVVLCLTGLTVAALAFSRWYLTNYVPGDPEASRLHHIARLRLRQEQAFSDSLTRQYSSERDDALNTAKTLAREIKELEDTPDDEGP